MAHDRPVLISVMQFEDELKQGAVSIFDVIDTAYRLGAAGVELRRELWPGWRNELQTARRRIEELGLLVTYATHITLFGREAGHEAQLRADIDAASAFGAPQLRVFLGPTPGDGDEAGWRAAADIIEYAGQQGVVVALENYARTPGGKLAEIQRVLNRIQLPALMTNIDIGNYALHGEDVPAAIRTVGARAVSAHLKDQAADHSEPPTYLGGGQLPLPAILAELDALPQRIIYCFEFRGAGEAEERIRHSMAYLQKRG
jgi:sugar phosphate isomerase/epimerase